MNQDKMRRCCPAGSAEIIGARMDINRRSQRPFTLPLPKLSRRKEDRYGSDQPVQSRFESIALTVAALVISGLCIIALLKMSPSAIEEMQTVARQAVAESRK